MISEVERLNHPCIRKREGRMPCPGCLGSYTSGKEDYQGLGLNPNGIPEDCR